MNKHIYNTTENNMIKRDDLCKIGQFAKPHGVKGEISLISNIDIAEITGDSCLVCNIDDIWIPFFIVSYRQKGASTTLVTLENQDSKDKVKFLTGKSVYVLQEQMPPKKEGQYSLKEFIGYLVIDSRLGELGILTDVDESTPNTLLKVDYKGRELLIPWKLFTSITFDFKTISIALPDGFLDIM